MLELVAALSKSVNLLPLLADKETSLDTQEEQLVDALNNAADLPGDIPGGLGSRYTSKPSCDALRCDEKCMQLSGQQTQQ